MPVVLYGPDYSVYARVARLALEEKGVAYEQQSVDIFAGESQTPEHLARQPWGKVPAFEHDGFMLYETFAITRYIDEAFPGPRLQPEEVRLRARMTQIIGVVDSYAYPAMILKVAIQALIVPMQGGTPDQTVIADGLAGAERALTALEALAGPGEFLCGKEVSLADLHLAPVFAYFTLIDQGREALALRPRLLTWWRHFCERPSMAKTQPTQGG
jgi:glutathione S-transferase